MEENNKSNINLTASNWKSKWTDNAKENNSFWNDVGMIRCDDDDDDNPPPSEPQETIGSRHSSASDHTSTAVTSSEAVLSNTIQDDNANSIRRTTSDSLPPKKRKMAYIGAEQNNDSHSQDSISNDDSESKRKRVQGAVIPENVVRSNSGNSSIHSTSSSKTGSHDSAKAPVIPNATVTLAPQLQQQQPQQQHQHPHTNNTANMKVNNPMILDPSLMNMMDPKSMVSLASLMPWIYQYPNFASGLTPAQMLAMGASLGANPALAMMGTTGMPGDDMLSGAFMSMMTAHMNAVAANMKQQATQQQQQQSHMPPVYPQAAYSMNPQQAVAAPNIASTMYPTTSNTNGPKFVSMASTLGIAMPQSQAANNIPINQSDSGLEHGGHTNNSGTSVKNVTINNNTSNASNAGGIASGLNTSHNSSGNSGSNSSNINSSNGSGSGNNGASIAATNSSNVVSSTSNNSNNNNNTNSNALTSAKISQLHEFGLRQRTESIDLWESGMFGSQDGFDPLGGSQDIKFSVDSLLPSRSFPGPLMMSLDDHLSPESHVLKSIGGVGMISARKGDSSAAKANTTGSNSNPGVGAGNASNNGNNSSGNVNIDVTSGKGGNGKTSAAGSDKAVINDIPSLSSMSFDGLSKTIAVNVDKASSSVIRANTLPVSRTKSNEHDFSGLMSLSIASASFDSMDSDDWRNRRISASNVEGLFDGAINLRHSLDAAQLQDTVADLLKGADIANAKNVIVVKNSSAAKNASASNNNSTNNMLNSNGNNSLGATFASLGMGVIPVSPTSQSSISNSNNANNLLGVGASSSIMSMASSSASVGANTTAGSNSSNNNNNSNNNTSKKNRGKYRCGRCGMPKTNHVCSVASDVAIVCSLGVQTDPTTIVSYPFITEKMLTIRDRQTIQDPDSDGDDVSASGSNAFIRTR